MSRRKDIDQLRGIAILLMVMVHSAATWAPTDASTTSILALVIAGLGGLAAPLFVTVGGWVTVQSSWTLRKALIRFAFLYAAQIAVNISAPQLFDPFSPGVLTLFALLYLTAPLWVRISENLQATLFFAFNLLTLNYVLLGNHDTLDWDDRTYVGGIMEHVEHLLLTGTIRFCRGFCSPCLEHLLTIPNHLEEHSSFLDSLGLLLALISCTNLYKKVFHSPSHQARRC